MRATYDARAAQAVRARHSPKRARLRGDFCATMESRGDRRQLQQHHNEPQDVRSRMLQIVDNSFASTCQAVRTNKEQCPFGCGKLLAPRTIDYHRLNGCRGKQDDAFADLSRKRSFTCGACYEEFVTRDAFFEHLNTEHAVEATIREYVFPDYATFERFRYWLEAQGGAHFRQKSGAKIRPSGKGIFMMCNRSGLVHTTTATGLPERDKLGSYRMGFTCTAFINGTIYQDGHVSVRCCGDHYGHDARVRLPQSVKNIIMHMQADGRTNSLIIRYLQDHFIPFGHTSIHAQRAAYVDLEELRSVTPVMRRLEQIPFNREEEWEQEFLDTAGIIRDWAPPYPPRADDWLPIKEFAEKMNWVSPLVFKAKVRNSAGEWMIYDEDRQVYVLESAMMAHYQDHDEDDLDEEILEQQQRQYEQPKEERVDAAGGGGGRGGRQGRRRAGLLGRRIGREAREEQQEDEEADVEEMRENKEEEMPKPDGASTSTATAASPATKKRRVERKEEEEEAEVMEDEVEEVEEHEEHEEGAASNGRPTFARSGFLSSSILAELEMIKALVKAESEFLSEAELTGYLRKTRALRLSFEPLSRGTTSAMGQREFAVPQLARPSRALPSRGRTRFINHHHRVGESRGGQYLGAGWVSSESAASTSSPLMHRKRVSNGGSSSLIVDSHDMHVCDEEIVVETSGGAARKLQFNNRMWN